jgi:sulfoxide reductase heme-binding subunit YedZ
VEFVTLETGGWALKLLILGLAMRPLGLIQYRRAVGVYAYMYALLHFSVWLWLDREFNLPEMLADVRERPYITAGFSALVLLTPLALTSTDGWLRRLGKWWGRLHVLVYPAVLLGCFHYLWLVKKDKRWPTFYLAATLVLLALRLPKAWRRRLPGAAA